MQQTHWCSLSLLVCAEQWRLYDNRCVWVWTESCSIFASVLRRSVPHERIPTWLPVERQGWGIWRGQAPMAGGLSPFFSHNPNSPKPCLVTLHMHPGPVPACSTAGLMDRKPRTCTWGQIYWVMHMQAFTLETATKDGRLSTTQLS